MTETSNENGDAEVHIDQQPEPAQEILPVPILRSNTQSRITTHLERLDEAIAICNAGLASANGNAKTVDIYLRHLTRLIALSGRLEETRFRMNFVFQKEEASIEEKRAQQTNAELEETLQKYTDDQLAVVRQLMEVYGERIPFGELLEKAVAEYKAENGIE
ncbi:MAG: hypothetical protein NXH72_14145 [Hyphomonadaceae bacterium]|nr:hypothetical protein [Hyphomonadaceae bacterium]